MSPLVIISWISIFILASIIVIARLYDIICHSFSLWSSPRVTIHLIKLLLGILIVNMVWIFSSFILFILRLRIALSILDCFLYYLQIAILWMLIEFETIVILDHPLLELLTINRYFNVCLSLPF
jgi:hypothetical protein